MMRFLWWWLRTSIREARERYAKERDPEQWTDRGDGTEVRYEPIEGGAPGKQRYRMHVRPKVDKP